MARPPARVIFNKTEMRRALRGSDGPVYRILDQRAKRVRDRAYVFCPVRSGFLRSTLDYRLGTEGGQPVAYVYVTASYGLFVHEGTGIYGPKRRPIEARPGRMFVFPGRDGKLVFTRRIKGMRPRPFLRQALQAVTEGT